MGWKRIEEEWGIVGTRLHPSGNGPIGRHTRLRTYGQPPNALSPVAGARPSSESDAFSIIRAFRAVYAFVG